jgi:hypothetical protein
MNETAFYRYVKHAYELLEERSSVNEYGERVFEGHFSKLLGELGFSKRWYSEIRSALLIPVEDPCIEIVQRGTANQNTIVILRHPPPPEWADLTAGGLTQARFRDTVYGRVEARVERLEAWRETLGGVNLAEALRNFEMRLSRLEAKAGGKDLNGAS